jgi:casein kinase 1/casein kinase 1 epsilon
MDANKIGKTFKLTKKLGSGAFGEIFLGINVMLKKF